MLPLRLGSPDQFASVREFLNQADYSEQAVCRRLGLGGLHEYLSRDEKSAVPAPAEMWDALEVLLRVLLVGNPVSRDLLGGFIPSAVQESMEALGILCADPEHPEQCYSPVVLYPVQGLYIASDRWKNPEGSPLPSEKDFVFPGIHPLTHDFLSFCPKTPVTSSWSFARARLLPHCWLPSITPGNPGRWTSRKERRTLGSSTAC